MFRNVRSAAGAFAVAAACFLPLASGAEAQDFPSEPIRLIVPFSPGGASDFTARALTATAQEVVAEPVLVENITGAGGVTGMLQAMTAEPDGHTLLISDNVMITLPLLQPNVPVDREKFQPVGIFNLRGAWLLVRPQKGWDTLDDFVEAARERPGELTVGIPSKGGRRSSRWLRLRATTTSTSTSFPTPAARPRWPHSLATRSMPR